MKTFQFSLNCFSVGWSESVGGLRRRAGTFAMCSKDILCAESSVLGMVYKLGDLELKDFSFSRGID